MVIEGDAGRDDVDQGEALVHQTGLDQRHQLGLVAGKGARHEAGTQGEGLDTGVDRRLLIGDALFGLGADIGRGRELAFGEAVDAIIFKHIEHVEIAADGVGELAETDRETVSIAGNADIVEIAIDLSLIQL